ncbi:MAG: quinolinate synthase NadA [Candidatus Magasanikiibacteriota bacterium]
MPRALFIGRFQPFHQGHLDAIKQISSDLSTSSRQAKIIIGIGSSQYSGTKDNPYSFAERKAMIEKIIKNKTKYKIVAIPDIHDETNWVKHVEKIVGKFDVVYTGNKVVAKLFRAKKHQVKNIKKNIDISATELRQETERLFEKLHHTCYTWEQCETMAPLTLEINKLKKKQKAVILAHSYQTPDIMYGVADYIGDSYGLSKIAQKIKAKKIIFCSVYFMGETAKILNTKKQVLVPATSGCSLAESITAKDVRKLKQKHPGVPVVCYINTYADVKAESDIVCTSANALKVINSLKNEEVIFIPDKLMGKNLQKLTKKKLILWDGTCIVHEDFKAEWLIKLRKQYPDAKVLAHTECNPAVVDHADLAGSTTDIVNYVKNTKTKNLMLITECGITDRVRTEFPNKNIVGTCNLCPYMKKIKLEDILQALKKPTKKQIVEVDKDIIKKAKKAVEKMMKIT